MYFHVFYYINMYIGLDGITYDNIKTFYIISV